MAAATALAEGCLVAGRQRLLPVGNHGNILCVKTFGQCGCEKCGQSDGNGRVCVQQTGWELAWTASGSMDDRTTDGRVLGGAARCTKMHDCVEFGDILDAQTIRDMLAEVKLISNKGSLQTHRH